MGIRTSVDLRLDRNAVFQSFVDELTLALTQLGMQFYPGDGGRVKEAGVEVGRVIHWRPPEEIVLEWHAASWQPADVTSMEFRFEALEEGTRITLENRGWGNVLGDQGSELAGWFASEAVAPLLRAMAPQSLGDWITDRRARRPSGPQSRAYYRDPLYHRPNFRGILEVLKLTRDDYLLEVGCGGGALLQEALRSGCRAAAIDHSSEMVGVARELNHEAIRQGRLDIREGDATLLPFADATFTCATATGVFAFIANPHAMLAEVRRVLAPGGRLVLFTGSKKLRGTPAAPEPVASRLHFYEDDELEGLALKAGFDEVHLARPDYEPYARAAGIPEEYLELFRGHEGGQLLVARKA